MTFNEQKLHHLLERAEQAHAAWRSTQDRYTEAVATRDRFKMAMRANLERNPHHKQTANDDAELARLNAEVARLQDEREAAQQRWASARAVADRCEAYAREHLGWSPEGPGRITGLNLGGTLA
ncbi:MAG: hypothetical protein AB7U81_14255 [Thiohalomonadaceae bacterium]